MIHSISCWLFAVGSNLAFIYTRVPQILPAFLLQKCLDADSAALLGEEGGGFNSELNVSPAQDTEGWSVVGQISPADYEEKWTPQGLWWVDHCSFCFE